jgi:hypothetical protein
MRRAIVYSRPGCSQVSCVLHLNQISQNWRTAIVDWWLPTNRDISREIQSSNAARAGNEVWRLALLGRSDCEEHREQLRVWTLANDVGHIHFEATCGARGLRRKRIARSRRRLQQCHEFRLTGRGLSTAKVHLQRIFWWCYRISFSLIGREQSPYYCNVSFG